MATKTFDDVKDERRANIRKALQLAIFAKKVEPSDTEVTQIWTTQDGLIIPNDYEAVGLTTKADGATWSADTDQDDTESTGHSEPTRSDLTKDVTGLQFTAQESKRLTMEMYNSLDLSAITADSDGNVSFDKPAMPAPIDWRILAVAMDGYGDDTIYFARWLPMARVTAKDSQSWKDSGGEVNYNMTLTGFVDDDYGTSLRELWGGPGFTAEDIGFLPNA